MNTFDPRVTPARPDLAARHLQGQVAAARFADGAAREVRDESAPLRREPARALPVPFCRYIFRVVPATSERVFVFAEPCRKLVWYMTTASCSNCLLMRGASSAGSISYLPTSLPALL